MSNRGYPSAWDNDQAPSVVVTNPTTPTTRRSRSAHHQLPPSTISSREDESHVGRSTSCDAAGRYSFTIKQRPVSWQPSTTGPPAAIPARRTSKNYRFDTELQTRIDRLISSDRVQELTRRVKQQQESSTKLQIDDIIPTRPASAGTNFCAAPEQQQHRRMQALHTRLDVPSPEFHPRLKSSTPPPPPPPHSIY
ncbi:hypothetical protein BCR43DRAFT_496889, partial [Syncephalastrum racemosum]